MRRFLSIIVMSFTLFGLAACVTHSLSPEEEAVIAPLAGTYTGQYIPDNGSTPRDVTIVVNADGTYDWSGAFVTPGVLGLLDDGRISYENDIGSRGVVTPNGNRLTWRNEFTGQSYRVIVSR